MVIKTFVSLPVEVKAIEWTGENFDEIYRFTNGLSHLTGGVLYIETTEGTSRASIGDHIIYGTQGEFYPVKPAVIENKYREKKD